MILKKHYKVLLACLLSILVLLALKTGGNVYKRVSSMHSVSFNGENGNVREGKTRLPCCKWDESVLVGPLHVNQEPIAIEKMRSSDEWLSNVRRGGQWSPNDCNSKAKVAIIIPFRNREKHLMVLLRHLHPVLQRQGLDYRIFVVNQNDTYPFNRAKLFNIGFKESQGYDDYDCFVFHDVDLIPEDDRNDYGCPSGPRHMSPAVSKFSYELISPYLFGGVTSFTKQDYLKVNGYPNKYYGWGAEDDDMYRRVMVKGMKVVRPPLVVGRYTMIQHRDEERNSKAKQLLSKGGKYIDKDGLNTLKYNVQKRENYDFYTEIEVDVAMTKEEKQLTSLKDLHVQKNSNPAKR